MPYHQLSAHFSSPEAAQQARQHFVAAWDTSGVWESMFCIYLEGDPQLAPVAEVAAHSGCLLAYQSGNSNKYVSFLEPSATELVIQCLTSHNVVGLANLLRGDLNAVQIWTAPELLQRPWKPTPAQQRRKLNPADMERFFQAAATLMAGKTLQDDYGQGEALLQLSVWSEGQWPDHLGQALALKGYRCEQGIFVGPSHLD